MVGAGKGLALAILAKKPKPEAEHDEEAEMSDMDMGLHDAAEEVMSAVKSGDVDMLKDALKSFHEQCSSLEKEGEY